MKRKPVEWVIFGNRKWTSAVVELAKAQMRREGLDENNKLSLLEYLNKYYGAYRHSI